MFKLRLDLHSDVCRQYQHVELWYRAQKTSKPESAVGQEHVTKQNHFWRLSVTI